MNATINKELETNDRCPAGSCSHTHGHKPQMRDQKPGQKNSDRDLNGSTTERNIHSSGPPVVPHKSITHEVQKVKAGNCPQIRSAHP